MRWIIIALCLILYVGIYPRELQYGAPSIFMIFGVVLVLIIDRLINKFKVL